MLANDFYFVLQSEEGEETLFFFIEKKHWDQSGNLNKSLPKNFSTILPSTVYPKEPAKFKPVAENAYSYRNSDNEEADVAEGENILIQAGFIKLGSFDEDGNII